MSDIIGGEFSILEESLNKNEAHYLYNEDIVFSSGRCALFAILKEIEYIRGKGGTTPKLFM